ncbi:MarR family winged helix-turn-helix transcriptional regulator [Microbacterium sp. YY-03]|uniref:MarR family winged helix-turn-helix transcriptional regulator n=1 Tax=Microbacterium sp. YY-03 TaxID=3421636 RepID=UPI003D172725
MTNAEAPDAFEAAIRQLESEFTHLMGHIRRSFRENANRVSPGMLVGTYKVLSFLASDGPLTASDIAERLMLDKGHLSRMIKDLDERGLITREADPTDKRATLLSVSEAGRERFTTARRPTREGLTVALNGFDPADIDTASSVLRALYRHRWPTADEGAGIAAAESSPPSDA